MSEEYRFIGKATRRRDAAEIVTGRARFVGDISLPGMLHGRVLRSPHPHANIRSIDTGRAVGYPGVHAVLTHKNAPKWKLGYPVHRTVLDSKVRFVGDALALIAAETEEIADEAMDLIDIEYEILPTVFDVEEAMKPGAPQLYDQFPGNILPPEFPWWGPNSLTEVNIGDVDRGLEEADVIVEGTYMYENIPNALPPEPPGIIAAWDGPDTLNVWLSSQGPYIDKTQMYLSLGRTVDIKVMGNACGASYGTKYSSLPVFLQAAALARAAGKPVKLCYTKEEHLAAFTLRLGSRIHGRVGMKQDGTVTAISGDWLINTGHYSHSTQGQIGVGCGEVQFVARCPNWKLKPKLVCTNRSASGIVRGYGGQELKCAFLPILTLAMEKLDIDPLEFFKNNYVKPGDGYYWRDGNWWVGRSVDYSRAMEEGARKFGWPDKWQGWLKPSLVQGNRRRGVGLGLHGNADTGEDVSEAYVRLDPDGTATIHSALSEHGTGQVSSLCKMVAEVLQIPLDRVFITSGDTSVTPYEFGPAGSRGTYAIGSAFIAAAEDARQKLFAMASAKLNVEPGDLETRDCVIYVKGKPEESISWRRVTGVTRTVLGYGRFEPDFTMPNFMMTFVEVEVDIETGKVELVNVVGATDVGQIIDPPSLKNQLNGCLGSAGIDSALLEESVLDKGKGYILTANMIDYKWRPFSDLPNMENVILETPFPSHRFRAIGVGEITTAPGPSAVLMAVSNAIGTRLYNYPVTPEKVLAALGRIKTGNTR